LQGGLRATVALTAFAVTMEMSPDARRRA
jgi:hypothetical protein